MLAGRVGEIFEGRVTDLDERGARIQLCQSRRDHAGCRSNGLEIGDARPASARRSRSGAAPDPFRAGLAFDPQLLRRSARRTEAGARGSLAATASGGLRLSGSSPGKASARIRVRVAPGSTMWTRMRPVNCGLVGIGAEQGLERGLGRAVGAPEGARLARRPRRSGRRRRPVRLAQQRIEGGDQRLVGEQVEAEQPRKFLGVDVLRPASASRASRR